jgi:hypothetical protein
MTSIRSRNAGRDGLQHVAVVMKITFERSNGTSR